MKAWDNESYAAYWVVKDPGVYHSQWLRQSKSKLEWVMEPIEATRFSTPEEAEQALKKAPGSGGRAKVYRRRYRCRSVRVEVTRDFDDCYGWSDNT